MCYLFNDAVKIISLMVISSWTKRCDKKPTNTARCGSLVTAVTRGTAVGELMSRLQETSTKRTKTGAWERRKEGNVLFNDALNTFYLRLYGAEHMVMDHSDSERRNPLPPLHWLLFPISSKGSFICTIP